MLSLTAVFLALAAGFVLGARLSSGPMVSVLRNDKDDLQKTIADVTGERDDLRQRLAAANDFDTTMSERMVRGALAGTSVLIIRAPDAEDADVDALARLIGQAGGSPAGTIALTGEFVSANSAEKLRSVVNSPIVPAGRQLDTGLVDEAAQAGDLLGLSLLINRDPAIAPVDDGAREAVLGALRDTGFLSYDRPPAAADTAVVITGGALAEDAGHQGATVARFAGGLAPHGSGTVLAGRDGSADGVSAVAVTRADAALSDLVSTVDDVDAESGRITSVLALQAMDGGAPAGRYGVGAGAAAVTVGQ